MKTTIFETGSLICPKCKSVLDAATSLDEDATPAINDITVCLYCSTILIYKNENDKIGLKEITQEELKSIEDDEPETYDSLIKAKAFVLSLPNNLRK